MPRPSWGAEEPTQPVRASDKRAGKGSRGGDCGPCRVGEASIRGAPSGAGPSGAGEMAAGHPTLREQAAVAAWCPMEPLIEVTPDILLWVGPGGGEAGWGEPSSEQG